MNKSDKIDEELINKHKQLVSIFLESNPLPSQPGNSVGGAE